MSGWRQMSTSRSNENQSIAQMSKIRLENARMRVELESNKKELEPLKQQVNKISAQLAQSKQKQQRLRNQMIKIGVIANCDEIHKLTDLSQFLDAIEKKMLENKERYLSIERELQKRSKNNSEVNVVEKMQSKERELETSIRTCKIREEEIQELRAKNNNILTAYELLQSELLKKDTILAQQSHKLTQLQIQKKDVELEMKNLRNTNKTESIKKECEDILGQIQIKDDDYLKSYLLKNQRFNLNTNSISRKNKYDFIFQ